MNLKGIVEFHDAMQEMSEEDLCSNKTDERIEEVGKYLDSMSDKGVKIVLERTNEEDLVKLLRTIKANLLENLGDAGAFLCIADRMGILEPFIHTIVLDTVGVLVDEEVL